MGDRSCPEIRRRDLRRFSGGLAQALVSVFGNAAVAVLFGIILAVLLGIAFLPGLFTQEPPRRTKPVPHYDQKAAESSSYDSETDRYVPSRSSHTSRTASKPRISDYNIPMDIDEDMITGESELLSSSEEAVPGSFFRQKSDAAYTPADLLLQILSSQTSSDSSPDISTEFVPVKPPEPEEQQPVVPVKPVKPVKYPAGWKPVVWTSTPRSEPAWAIPVSKSRKNETDEEIPETAAETSPEEEIEQKNSFVLIGYQEPQRVRKTVKRKNRQKIQEDKLPSSFLPAQKPLLLLPERSTVPSVRLFPVPSSLLLPISRTPLLSPENILSMRINDAESGENAFVLIDYFPPEKQPNHYRARYASVCPVKQLPSPPPNLLPAAPSYLRLPQISDVLLLPTPAVECSTSFVLIDYVPPQKQAYNLKNSNPKCSTFCPARQLAPSAPALLLPPVPQHPLFSQVSDRLLLPALKEDAPALSEELSAPAEVLLFSPTQLHPFQHLDKPLSFPVLHNIISAEILDKGTFIETESSATENNAFTLINYTPPTKRVHRLKRPKPDNRVYLNNGLPSPAPVLFLPAALPYPLLPCAPDQLLLPASCSVSDETSFILINYFYLSGWVARKKKEEYSNGNAKGRKNR